jgi:hypothetical protein
VQVNPPAEGELANLEELDGLAPPRHLGPSYVIITFLVIFTAFLPK